MFAGLRPLDAQLTVVVQSSPRAGEPLIRKRCAATVYELLRLHRQLRLAGYGRELNAALTVRARSTASRWPILQIVPR